MTGDKVKEVVRRYSNDDLLTVTARSNQDGGSIAEHLKYMCEQIEEFIDAGRVEKAMRWLGFLQGVMWRNGWYTIEELAEQNRPDVAEAEGTPV